MLKLTISCAALHLAQKSYQQGLQFRFEVTISRSVLGVTLVTVNNSKSLSFIFSTDTPK